MVEIVKAGSLLMLNKGEFSDSWVKVNVKLHRDSTLMLYKKKDDPSPKTQIRLQDVATWIRAGRTSEAMPNRPELPKDATVDHVIAFPNIPSTSADIHWFLCANPIELNEWMTAIHTVVPSLGQFYPIASYPNQPPPYQAYPSVPVAAPLYGYPPPAARIPQTYPVYPPQQAHIRVAVVKEKTVKQKKESGFSAGALVAGMAGGALLGWGLSEVREHDDCYVHHDDCYYSSSSSDSDW